MAAHAVDVVDVLDVDRALLDTGPAVGAGPDDLGVDDPHLGHPADQRPGRLGLDQVGQALPLALLGQQVRSLGEGVVAQVEDELLGRQRLAGRPGRALRLAATALGARAQVEHALPRQVLHLPDPEHVRVWVSLLEVQRLAAAAHRLQRAQRVWPPREQNIDQGGRDVQVLRIEDEHYETHDQRELGEDEGRLQYAVRADAQRGKPAADRLGGERAMPIREVARVGLRTPVDQQGRHDEEDPQQDEPGRTCMRTREPRRPARPLRRVPQPDDRERDNARQHAQGEYVLQEADPGPGADAPDSEPTVEEVPVGLQNRQHQDKEAPEGQRMSHPRHGPLKQLALPYDLSCLLPYVLYQMLTDHRNPFRRRLPSPPDAEQPPYPPPRDCERRRSQDQSDSDPYDQVSLLVRHRPTAVPNVTSCRHCAVTSASIVQVHHGQPTEPAPGRILGTATAPATRHGHS